MMRRGYDVNLSIMFTHLNFADRPAAAKAAGFDAVECWWPFAEPVPDDREVDAFVRIIEDAEVELVCLNLYGGDLAAGDRGVLSCPGAESTLVNNLAVAAEIGTRLGCGTFNALYGNRLPGVDPSTQDDMAAHRLALVAHVLAETGGTVVLEPLSGIPDHPLRTADDAVAVIDRVGAPNLRLLFDVHHLVANGVDLEQALERHGRRIGHVQLADVPGRAEPGTGRIDFDGFLRRLAEVGYDGHVGLEHLVTTETPFAWLDRVPSSS